MQGPDRETFCFGINTDGLQPIGTYWFTCGHDEDQVNDAVLASGSAWPGTSPIGVSLSPIWNRTE